MHTLKSAAPSNGVALIIEDDECMRALLAAMVRDLGFTRSIEAANIADALGALTCDVATLVLVDLCLMDEDGIELVEAIRTHAAQTVRDLPIVVVSRAASEARVRAATDAGADGFIAKPLSAATFHRQVSLAYVKRCLTTPQPSRQQDVLAAFRGARSNDRVAVD